MWKTIVFVYVSIQQHAGFRGHAPRVGGVVANGNMMARRQLNSNGTVSRHQFISGGSMRGGMTQTQGTAQQNNRHTVNNYTGSLRYR